MAIIGQKCVKDVTFQIMTFIGYANTIQSSPKGHHQYSKYQGVKQRLYERSTSDVNNQNEYYGALINEGCNYLEDTSQLTEDVLIKIGVNNISHHQQLLSAISPFRTN